MVKDRLPATLRAYRLFSTAARIFTPLLLARRLNRGKELRPRIAQRRGQSHFGRPSGQLIWLHAASVRELVSASPFIERIKGREINILVTSGTVTSSNLAMNVCPAWRHSSVRTALPSALCTTISEIIGNLIWRCCRI